MALIVENGTGLADAESYITVAELKSFCTSRGYSLAGSSDTVLEQRLRQAATYIDTILRYKGSKLSSGQALEFPRESLTDDAGLAVAGVPRRVKQAAGELAYKALAEALYQDLERGGKVVSESVGPISTTYADDAPGGKVWTLAHNLLAPYVRGNKDRNGPVFASAALPATEGGTYFGLGMHDNPSSGATAFDSTLGD